MQTVGCIIGFYECMNLVLDDAQEMRSKMKSRKPLDQIILKGDDIIQFQSVSSWQWSGQAWEKPRGKFRVFKGVFCWELHLFILFNGTLSLGDHKCCEIDLLQKKAPSISFLPFFLAHDKLLIDASCNDLFICEVNAFLYALSTF